MKNPLLLLMTVLLIAKVGNADPLTWEPSVPSDMFVNSIGVCTHWGYDDTPYGQSFEQVKARLAESGIRNIRDGYHPHEVELWDDLGVQSTVLAEPQSKSLADQLVIWDANPAMFGMIEGPNEPNNFWTRNNVTYKGAVWPEALRLWQADLYNTVRSDKALDNIPVTSPTPIFSGPAEAAPITSFDYLAVHPYPGGGIPSSSIEWGGQSLRTSIALIGTPATLVPFVATETGYHNCTASDTVIGGQQHGISEAAGAKYFPRLFAEYWNAGFVRTFTYEFLDEFVKPDDPEANFGLIRHDLSPKPSFVAVSNMIKLLTDSHWDLTARKWITPPVQARAIQIGFIGPSTVHHLLLSRADGSNDLLLWNEVSSYNIAARTDIDNPPVAVTVLTASTVGATLYKPSVGTMAVQKWSPSRSIVVDVPDEVVILRLATTHLPIVKASPPIDLSANTTGTSATLHWNAGNGQTSAYIVRRLTRYIATVVPDGNNYGGSFTDSALSPGIGYTYSVQSVSPVGALSGPETITAHTSNLRPDLTINSVSWSPSNPQSGDEVTFTAVIENIGMAPTPNVTHGVAFAVDGHVVCWSDNSDESLLPNQTRSLRSDSGPSGKGTWTAMSGAHTVSATVDDVNRIDESNKLNNTLGPLNLNVK